MPKPLAIDLYCGLGGWTEGLLAEGYEVVGFDIVRHRYPERWMPDTGGRKVVDEGVDFSNPNVGSSRNRSFNYANERAVAEAPLTGRWAEYPAQLVVQDVLTLHGSQFRDATLIVASPPCQEYSYMAMPWKLAKAKAAAIRADTTGKMLADLTRLFDACFRIQAQASLAAGRHIPMVVENVRGAIPWVGRSRWNFGSYHLWGDVPALMPLTDAGSKVSGFRFNGSGSFQSVSVAEGLKLGRSPGRVWSERPVAEFNDPLHGAFHRRGSGTLARKTASAMIAKIPLPLSRHVAAVYRA